jgi:hypothetical protein
MGKAVTIVRNERGHSGLFEDSTALEEKLIRISPFFFPILFYWFPDDFFFELTKEEQRTLRSQSGTLKRGGHSKYRAYAFTEQGVAMLSGVLRGSRAVQVNIAIMRAFVRLREIIRSNKGLARRLAELEKKYDGQVRVVFEAIRELMEEPKIKARRIGFRT